MEQPIPAEGSTPTSTGFAIPVPPHTPEVKPWRQKGRAGTREDRMVREVVTQKPPLISAYSPVIPPQLSSQADTALTELTRLDSEYGRHLAPLSTMLLRAESVASSKIEHIEASLEDYARAEHGQKSNSSAVSMVASTKAISKLIDSVSGAEEITLNNLLAAHRILMADDPQEATYAGRLRDMQNWIGGSDHSPRNALFVPPPPENVEGLLTDLLAFTNRNDVPILVQAAVAHAQFESIHPFTDGNGRIGRALVNTILRRRGVTKHVVVPIASALVARRETYFDALAEYRRGNAGPIVHAFTRASLTSERESKITAVRLSQLPAQWATAYIKQTGKKPRSGSAAAKILELLPTAPFFTADEMASSIGSSSTSTYNAISSLQDSDILRPLTNRKREQVWCAGALMDELEDLGNRISRQTTLDSGWQALVSQIASHTALSTEVISDAIQQVLERHGSLPVSELAKTLPLSLERKGPSPHSQSQ